MIGEGGPSPTQLVVIVDRIEKEKKSKYNVYVFAVCGSEGLLLFAQIPRHTSTLTSPTDQ